MKQVEGRRGSSKPSLLEAPGPRLADRSVGIPRSRQPPPFLFAHAKWQWRYRPPSATSFGSAPHASFNTWEPSVCIVPLAFTLAAISALHSTLKDLRCDSANIQSARLYALSPCGIRNRRPESMPIIYVYPNNGYQRCRQMLMRQAWEKSSRSRTRGTLARRCGLRWRACRACVESR